jgi:deazaflavin-dependent oxidoreductase (nitroreductase family)
MSEARDWNSGIIGEFRAKEGVVGGPFEGAPLLLLTSTGAKTGRQHTTPVMYLPDGDRFVVFASKGGAPADPDWYRNLVANPEATVEVGTERFGVKAEIVVGAERDTLFARQAAAYPQFAEYEQKTDRVIPVVALVRAD